MSHEYLLSSSGIIDDSLQGVYNDVIIILEGNWH